MACKGSGVQIPSPPLDSYPGRLRRRCRRTDAGRPSSAIWGPIPMAAVLVVPVPLEVRRLFGGEPCYLYRINAPLPRRGSRLRPRTERAELVLAVAEKVQIPSPPRFCCPGRLRRRCRRTDVARGAELGEARPRVGSRPGRARSAPSRIRSALLRHMGPHPHGGRLSRSGSTHCRAQIPSPPLKFARADFGGAAAEQTW